jgi:hypothetical protein
VPLCTNGAGDVGWLDFKALGCPGNNLADWIGPPACDVNVPTPGWYQAKTGNTNAPEDNLNAYAGQIVSIPLFDGTCRYDPGDVPCPPEDTGSGSNFWYHIPRIEAFLLDRAYVQGNNHPECNQGPGYPPVGGNGETGCLKGWFLDLVSNGQVGDSSGTGGNPSYLGVQLVR